jgi:integrase
MSTEFGLYKDAIRIANALYADSLAAGFTPLSLRACQSKMIEKGWTRGTVNKAVSRLKHIWGWAVGEQLIDPMVHHGLCCVRGLKPGRSEARESEPVRPVDDAIVEATLPYCSPPVKAMVQLQRLTGARPGEICQMRIGDIDRSGKEWIYKPRRHKNTHRGQDRSIYIGPKGQEILGPFLLKLNPEAFCFSPIEADRQRREEKHARRKTPLNAGNSPGTNVRKKPKWQPRDHYDTGTYNKSVRRACLKAFPPPPPLGRNPGETWEEWRTRIKASPELTEELAKWQKEHCWHVHQLRHSAATQAKQEFDLDAARAMLGHKHINMTERYVDADSTLARKVAAKIG